MTIKTPACVHEKMAELEELCNKYPERIPIHACAKFLGMTGDSLRAMIETRRCPFALGWIRQDAANRTFCIPTATFFFWYTCPSGQQFGMIREEEAG